jgi:galactokinase
MDALAGLINRLKDHFSLNNHRTPLLVASPGRVNLIGEHTDYNGGYALPAAIDKYIVCALSKNELDHCRISSLDMNETFELTLENLEKVNSGSWKNYVIGVVHGLTRKSKNMGNFDLAFCGNIPIGAGLSSSAALENGVACGLNELFELGLSKQTLVEISMAAEHNFAGVKCGMMDQYANMNGRTGHALLIDFSDASSEDIPLQAEGLSFVLINSNVKHQLSDSPYNERKQQCEDGLQALRLNHPETTSLGDCDMLKLEGQREALSDVVFGRCKYVIEENERVLSAVEAIKQNDWTTFGQALFASHIGLSELYEVSCEELDFLVDEAAQFPGVLGSRMMGGGFGGCTINLVKSEVAGEFEKHIQQAYQQQFDHEVTIIPIQISSGTHVIEE